MKKSKNKEPLVPVIENALSLGQFISYGRSWDFVSKLEEVESQIGELVKNGQSERAVNLYEILLSGCYEKAEEIDDSGGNLGMFAQEVFISWIKARQKAEYSPEETVKYILRWMVNDDYGFCYDTEKDIARTLDKEGFLLFREHFENQLDLAFAPFKDQDPKFIHDYPYEVRGPLISLKAIYTAKKDAKSYLALCKKTIVSPKDCEAIASMYKAKRRFADALVWVKKGLVIGDDRQWGNQSGYGLNGMKRELLNKLGRKEDVLKAAWSEFRKDSDVFRYEDLMKYVPKKDQQSWHKKAMQEAKKGSLSDFIEICVKTREWDMLSKRIDSTKHENIEKIGHYVTEGGAKGLVRNHKPSAAKIYRALGMRIIKSGKSKYYQAALEHFQKAKELYEKSGQNQKWSSIVAIVRKNHYRKYGFINDFETIVTDGKLESAESFESKVQKRWKRQIR